MLIRSLRGLMITLTGSIPKDHRIVVVSIRAALSIVRTVNQFLPA
ncbi:unnamed protein product [Echinostoma caproni]|uniref:Uncharacterized protein n=1 Tax=Echinostoma caproni TaxID=27848 RepID=A0A3P8DTW5_9TREM|nr:unnamed protein product [Echinostoma caproni]